MSIVEREKRSRRKVFVCLIIFCPLPSGDLETTGWRRKEEEDRRASSKFRSGGAWWRGFPAREPYSEQRRGEGEERRTLANSHKVLTDFVF